MKRVSQSKHASAVEFPADFGTSPLEADFSTPDIVKAIAEVGRQRNELLAKLREALLSRNSLLALELASELCGLKHETESCRTNPRIN